MKRNPTSYGGNSIPSRRDIRGKAKKCWGEGKRVRKSLRSKAFLPKMKEIVTRGDRGVGPENSMKKGKRTLKGKRKQSFGAGSVTYQMTGRRVKNRGKKSEEGDGENTCSQEKWRQKTEGEQARSENGGDSFPNAVGLNEKGRSTWTPIFERM